jgi:nucleoside-diphosphate-sugar epimerase
MRSVVITGANGFIGRNLANKLASSGVKVFAIVRNKERSKDLFLFNSIEIIECDVFNYNKLEKYLSKCEIDVFYHFAWEGVGDKKRFDYNIQLNNLRGTCDAINVANKLEIKRFIFAGSIMEYEYKKCIEKNIMKVGLGNMYAIAKISARQMAQTLAYNLNIEFIPTIISNVYGVGEVSDRLLNSTLRKLLNGEKTSFTAGNQLYDFIFIDDAVRALKLIGEKGTPFKNYYIGNRIVRPLKEFIMIMRDCIDKNIKLGLGDIQFNGVSLEYNEFDLNSLTDEFGFATEVSFEEGVNKTIEWIKKEHK